MKCSQHLYDFGYYGPGSIIWKVNREWVVALSLTRAVLMQVAHPLVALGVSNHTNFVADPFGRATRTLMRWEEQFLGSLRIAHQSARMVNNQHKLVHGVLPMDAGCFPKGTPYDARDPELLLWVHATGVDSLLLGYKVFVGQLTHAEEERYYQESKKVAHLLGLLPSQMPQGIDDLKHYIHEMLQSDCLAPTLQGRELAFQTLFPPVHAALRPLMHLNLNITNALLPQRVRDIFGLEWSKNQQRTFELSARSMRLIVPRLPMLLRELPITRRLMHGEIRQTA